MTHVNLCGDISEQTPPAERENLHLAVSAAHAAAVKHFYYPFNRWQQVGSKVIKSTNWQHWVFFLFEKAQNYSKISFFIPFLSPTAHL